MKNKLALTFLVGMISLVAQAQVHPVDAELLCVPEKPKTAPFKCAITQYKLTMADGQSPGKFELITNSDQKIATSAVIYQDEAGLGLIELKARGLNGKIEASKVQRVGDFYKVPAVLNVFDLRTQFKGNLLCQGGHTASDSTKEACGKGNEPKVESAEVFKPAGVKPNPVLAPLGQLVNVKTGEVLYVNAVISVVTPDQLDNDCIYEIHFTRDAQIKSRVRLVPPLAHVSCGHSFPTAR